MGVVGLVGVLTLWATVAAGPEGAAAADGLPRAIHTRQTLFAIPFQMSDASQRARDPIRVLLYVSTNQGTTWELNAQTEPAKQQFLFRAGGDGEFWFILRTSLGGEPTQPRPGERPGLRVVVDTTPPRLDLLAERGTGGQVVVRWKITEANFAPESLKIQYRVGGEQPWQTVAIDRPSDAAPGPNYTGEATWGQPGDWQRVEVRGEATDLAGNAAVSHAQLNASLGLDGLSRPRPAPDLPPAAGASDPSQHSGLPQLNAPGKSPNARLPSSAWRAVRRSSSRETSEEAETAAAPESPAPSAGSFSRDRTFSGRSAQGTDAAPVQPPSAHLIGAHREFAGPGSWKDRDAGPSLRVVNSLSFTLEYDFGVAEPASDEFVEFWGTRDGGRTWVSFGADTDRRSPMAVTVSEEGLYGFRAGVRRATDPRSTVPERGALPDLWVVVRSGDSQAASTSANPARVLDAQAAPVARPLGPSGL